MTPPNRTGYRLGNSRFLSGMKVVNPASLVAYCLYDSVDVEYHCFMSALQAWESTGKYLCFTRQTRYLSEGDGKGVDITAKGGGGEKRIPEITV